MATVEGEFVDSGDRVGTGEDTAHGHEDDVDQRVFASTLDSRVGKVLEMPLKRSRSPAGHQSLLLEVEINASLR
jgi:hypothetical protein